jgi:single-stranded DNA-binding protein
VVGRLKQDRWTGADGKNHSKVSIVAEHVEYRADFKKTDESENDELPAGSKLPDRERVESMVEASAHIPEELHAFTF